MVDNLRVFYNTCRLTPYVLFHNSLVYIYRALEQFTFWLNRREHFGAFRFRLQRFVYWLMNIVGGFPKTKNKVWDFILNYIPPLNFVYYKDLKVLDVGCVDTLLVYELAKRHYQVYGLDIRDFQVKLPKSIGFYKCNLLEELPKELMEHQFNYIIASAVIELVGTNKYNDGLKDKADRIALENIHKMLSPVGYFILCMPIWNFKFINGRGYTFCDIVNLISGLFSIFEITQRDGVICVVLIKITTMPDGRLALARMND